MISQEDGRKLLQLCRKSINSSFERQECRADASLIKNCSENLGCFVTLHEDGQLRGCIGFPEPIMPLHKAIIAAARAAAFEDPRFPSLEPDEMKTVTVEISVLTKPEEIKAKSPDDYVNAIKVGRDGLIIRGPLGSGLLLPQVATEYGWDSRAFLEHTCQKAGLAKEAWKDRSNKIYSFQAQIFSEDATHSDDKTG